MFMRNLLAYIAGALQNLDLFTGRRDREKERRERRRKGEKKRREKDRIGENGIPINIERVREVKRDRKEN